MFTREMFYNFSLPHVGIWSQSPEAWQILDSDTDREYPSLQVKVAITPG